jgi:hypothetical protein
MGLLTVDIVEGGAAGLGWLDVLPQSSESVEVAALDKARLPFKARGLR